MSTQYNTEPPPTASVLLHTSAGPLTISLFTNQTPLTCRNFLQHILDAYYTNNLFHRVASGFVIQTGDPTATGEGGQNIYEDREFEKYDEYWARLLGREKGEKIVFKDEIHSRLKFNRRGLIGLAKGTGDDGGYGSQFFVTLGDCRAELDGKCTMFGRVEGDGIYNIVKIAEGELVDGTERPMYPERILKTEILQMPQGEAWQAMKPRQRISERVLEELVKKKKAVKKKPGKALLSFGGEEGDSEGPGVVVRPKKAKFNTSLIDGGHAQDDKSKVNGKSLAKTQSRPSVRQKEPPVPVGSEPKPQIPQKRKQSSPSPSPAPTRSSTSPTHHRKPSFHDSTTQLPLRDPESPSRSPTPTRETKASALEAEIAALKASMRRDIAPAANTSKSKKSALESLIPSTSTRGRKRPRPGESNSKDDANALKILNAFKARLEDIAAPAIPSKSKSKPNGAQKDHLDPSDAVDEEATLCDLHFIANCQSCSNWDKDVAPNGEGGSELDDDNDRQWMSHILSFEKDRLGKDLTWKRKNEEELVVIDPREREKELKGKEREKKKKDWDRDNGKGVRV